MPIGMFRAVMSIGSTTEPPLPPLLPPLLPPDNWQETNISEPGGGIHSQAVSNSNLAYSSVRSGGVYLIWVADTTATPLVFSRNYNLTTGGNSVLTMVAHDDKLLYMRRSGPKLMLGVDGSIVPAPDTSIYPSVNFDGVKSQLAKTRNGSHFFVGSPQGIHRAGDSAQDWALCVGGAIAVSAICASISGTVIIGRNFVDYTVYRSTEFGDNPTAIAGLNLYIEKIATDDNETWVVIAADGSVAKISVDDGLTWQDLFTPAGLLRDISTDGYGAWVLATSAQAYITDDILNPVWAPIPGISENALAHVNQGRSGWLISENDYYAHQWFSPPGQA